MSTLRTVILGSLLWEIVLHLSLAMKQPSGFISVDCGGQVESFVQPGCNITYFSDSKLMKFGESKSFAYSNISKGVNYLLRLRTFPKGNRNCYTLQPVTPGSKYLIRPQFLYGNFDGLNSFPQFDLYLENTFVHTVNDSVMYEFIVKATRSYLTLCLCKTNERDPFISAIDVRPLGDTIYPVVNATLALKLVRRYNFGSFDGEFYRYPDDAFDRFWTSPAPNNLTSIKTSLPFILETDPYMTPLKVMEIAIINPISSRGIQWTPSGDFAQDSYFFMCIHFAELKKLDANETREFDITLDGGRFYGPMRPSYLKAMNICSPDIYRTNGDNLVELNPTKTSTLSPILNAIELYTVVQLPSSATEEGDSRSLLDIMKRYLITKIWTGDPCLPRNYTWEGLVCSNDTDTSSPRIISLDLSNSGLSGEIPTSLANLTAIVSINLAGNNLTGTIPYFLANLTQLRDLDLSGNSLTGSIPDSFVNLIQLKVLDLSDNNLNGSVPNALLRKMETGSLTLSIFGNKELCSSGVCDFPPGPKPKPSKGIVIGVSVSAGLLFLMIASAIIVIKTKKRNPPGGNPSSNCSEEARLEMSPGRCQAFTFKEVEKITDNFRQKIGKGGFGPVYLGRLKGQKVAVKVSSDESKQGFKEFHNEVELLSRVHYKHVVSFLGYCHDAKRMILIYEYLSRGSLEDALSGQAQVNLDWNQRLQIALDAAQGLDYLHSGCKPAIIHRDVKSANILLNDKLEAKIADFGLSKPVAPEGVTHVTTAIKGTPGYLDPEYYGTCCLNEKSDVYSFGIVLLELVSGKRHVIDVPSGEKINIAHWVRQSVLKDEHANIADRALCGRYKVDSLRRVVDLALQCTRDKGVNRPKMCDVVTELKEAIRSCAGKQIQHESGKSSSSDNTDSDSAFLVPR